MKRILAFVLMMLMLASLCWGLDVVKLLAINDTELTDAAATYNSVINTEYYQDIVIDVVSDKGGTLVVWPIPDGTDVTSLGIVYNTVTVADGGPANRGSYSPLASPKAKILFTKTEAGTTTGFKIVVHGLLY